jgi:hypothetical protein
MEVKKEDLPIQKRVGNIIFEMPIYIAFYDKKSGLALFN